MRKAAAKLSKGHGLRINLRKKHAETVRCCGAVRTRYPEVCQKFSNLAETCHNAGPLDKKTRRLIKLTIAVGAGTEAGTHSAVRHATEGGVTAQEMEHVVLLSITSIGSGCRTHSHGFHDKV